jgi:hypothetical protein
MNTYVATVTVIPPWGTIPGYDAVVGNISFSVFIANVKLFHNNGTLSYALLPTPIGENGYRVYYEFGAPFFSNTTAFFSFLVLLFSFFDVLGFMLGMILCYVVSRALKSKSIGHIP